jgi:hypothetical protein
MIAVYIEVFACFICVFSCFLCLRVKKNKDKDNQKDKK